MWLGSSGARSGRPARGPAGRCRGHALTGRRADGRRLPGGAAPAEPPAADRPRSARPPGAAAMAGPGLWTSIKSLLRRSEDPLFLNDSSAFDFSDEVGDEDFPRFNKLRVVVSDEASETAPEAPVNGAPLGLPSDDDSLLDRDIALRSARAGRPDPCSSCSSRRERSKQRKVKKRLTLAALLYLLFMTGELIGESGACFAVSPARVPRSPLRCSGLVFKYLLGETVCHLERSAASSAGEKEQSAPVFSMQEKKEEFAASLT